MKCFFHSSDMDGNCSGAIIKMYYSECEMIGINYGDEFPWKDIDPSEYIFMVDFSLQPFNDMLKLYKICGNNLIWIDHHKSAIEDCKKFNHRLIKGIREDGIGACELVWKYLHNTMIPTFIKLLAEYDVWNHSDPRTLPFQYGIRQIKDTSPNNIDFWNSLFDTELIMRIVENGGIIFDYQNSENEKYASACAFETVVNGMNCIVINKMITNSKLFDSVWNPDKYYMMITFGFRKGQWTMSLYSTRDDVDCSVIAKDLAKKYGNGGGGGHKGASGCQVDSIDFLIKGGEYENKNIM